MRIHQPIGSFIGLLSVVLTIPMAASGQIMLSGNENKIDLTGGAQRVLHNVESDSLTLINFAHFPPETTDIIHVPNTVVGPPSNIAITKDGKLALVANSIKIASPSATNWTPESYVHIVDLSARPPRVVGKVETGSQPSGLSITPNGKLALVCNRADGTLEKLEISGQTVKSVGKVKVCEPAESLSDVAISPDGKFALASVLKGGYLAVLKIDGNEVTLLPRKISVAGQPYRCVISPDEAYAYTAGNGFGNGLDMDALSIIDLRTPEFRTVDYVPLGTGPESIEVSPDGRLIVAVVMDGSNLDAHDPKHSNGGALIVVERKGKTFTRTQRIPIGRIPEGVAFTSDGKYLAVQCHPDRNIWLFSVKNGKVTDTGRRVDVPGMPSSLRASP